MQIPTADRVLYALLVASAIGCAGLLWRRSPRTVSLNCEQRWAIGLGAFAGAMIGARLPFLIYQGWKLGLDVPLLWSDGKTILSGLLGGYLGVEIAKAITGVRQRLGDGFALPVAVGVAIGRTACFVAGCCYGQPTGGAWGVVFPLSGDRLPRHPTQLYEVAFHLACAGAIVLAMRRGWFQGHLLKGYLLAYLAYRFASEFWRPEPSWWAGLTVYQWACLPLAALLLAHAFWQERFPAAVPCEQSRA